MATMGSTLYLTKEKLSSRNYPEVSDAMESIQEIITYIASIGSAIEAYTNGSLDHININVSDLQKYTTLCRNICDTLGSAPNVCFDILTELREMQNGMQVLIFVKNRYGNQYIGTPTNSGVTSSLSIL